MNSDCSNVPRVIRECLETIIPRWAAVFNKKDHHHKFGIFNVNDVNMIGTK
jgi:hypothetical protein